MKKYRAIFSDDADKKNYSKDGFDSEESAKEYIKTKLCDSCKINSSSLEESPCFAEWLIEEYDDKDTGQN